MRGNAIQPDRRSGRLREGSAKAGDTLGDSMKENIRMHVFEMAVCGAQRHGLVASRDAAPKRRTAPLRAVFSPLLCERRRSRRLRDPFGAQRPECIDGKSRGAFEVVAAAAHVSGIDDRKT
jgi:hypothetical protein